MTTLTELLKELTKKTQAQRKSQLKSAKHTQDRGKGNVSGSGTKPTRTANI